MPNLPLAQEHIARGGNPLLMASVRSLVDPFRSAAALAEVALESPDAPTPSGLPTWLYALRCASLLEPPELPVWRSVLECAAERACQAQDALRWPTSRAPARDALALVALCSMWLRRVRRPVPALEARWAELLPSLDAALDARHVPTLCAAVAAQGVASAFHDDGASGRARGALLDLLEHRRLDGMDLPLVLEAAVLSSAGSRDRLARLAREALAERQDAHGAFPTSLGTPQGAESTWWSLLLLMRGV